MNINEDSEDINDEGLSGKVTVKTEMADVQKDNINRQTSEEPSKSENQPSPSSSTDPLQGLERRQDAILDKLKGLRETLDKLTGQYETSSVTPTPGQPAVTATGSGTAKAVTRSTAAKVRSPVGHGIHDVVVSADPDHPPLSLFVLYELMKQQFKVLATSYVHSSVISVDERLCDAIKSGCQVTRGEHEVALSVIWKKVANGPQLMISPTKQSVVSGEVNIARYINRLLSPDFDTENIVKATYIDEWLDVADNQLIYGNSKQKAAALKNLNSRLKRNDWIFGDSFSLVDLVMWSALHQSQQAASAPEHVKKWMKSCEGLPPFKTAVMFISA